MQKSLQMVESTEARCRPVFEEMAPPLMGYQLCTLRVIPSTERRPCKIIALEASRKVLVESIITCSKRENGTVENSSPGMLKQQRRRRISCKPIAQH